MENQGRNYRNPLFFALKTQRNIFIHHLQAGNSVINLESTRNSLNQAFCFIDTLVINQSLVLENPAEKLGMQL